MNYECFHMRLLTVASHAGASIYSGTMKGGKNEALGWQHLASRVLKVAKDC